MNEANGREMNRVQLEGSLYRMSHIQYDRNSNPYVKLTIRQERKNHAPYYLRCKAYGRQAKELVLNYSEGDHIFIDGALVSYGKPDHSYAVIVVVHEAAKRERGTVT